MKIISQTETQVVVEDDGGFINVMNIEPKRKPTQRTKEEQESFEKKLDELGIIGF